MYPELFRLGPINVHSFGVMMALAFVSAGIVGWWQFRKRGINPEFVYVVVLASMIGGVLGSKIHYVIIHPEDFPEALWSGFGLVWYGGLVGALATVIVVTLVAKKPLGAVMDTGAVAVSVGYAVGRIGCFLRGDDYGVPTDLPWGMAFPEGLPPTTVRVHPTQLYETAASLVIFAILVWVISPRLHRDGSLMACYLVLAGIERFLVEFVRTNPGVVLGLTQQQWISIGLVIIGMAGVMILERYGRPRYVPAKVEKRPVKSAGVPGDLRKRRR